MSTEEEIKWVKLELNFSDEEEALLERVAQNKGLSVKCLCLRLLLQELAGDPQIENWQMKEAATLHRNGCQDKTETTTASL